MKDTHAIYTCVFNLNKVDPLLTALHHEIHRMKIFRKNDCNSHTHTHKHQIHTFSKVNFSKAGNQTEDAKWERKKSPHIHKAKVTHRRKTGISLSFSSCTFFRFLAYSLCIFSSLVIIVPSVSVKWNQCALYFAKMTTHEINKSSNTEQKWFVKETTKAVTYKNGEKIHVFWTRRCAWAKGNKTESNPCNKLHWHKHTFKRRKKVIIQ